MVASKEEEGKRESSGSASDEQHPETCLVRAGIWSLIELYQMMENIFRDLPKPLKRGSFLPQRTVNHDLPPPNPPGPGPLVSPQVGCCCVSLEAVVWTRGNAEEGDRL